MPIGLSGRVRISEYMSISLLAISPAETGVSRVMRGGRDSAHGDTFNFIFYFTGRFKC